MIRVAIIYQVDLGGPVAGGIDSVIRGIAQTAPHDIEVRVVGLTVDPVARPVGKWIDVQLGDRTVPFLPVGVDPASMVRKGMPLSLRLTLGVMRFRSEILNNCDVLEFHRIEAAFPLLYTAKGKNTIVHANYSVLRNKNSDMRWRWFPALFFGLEKLFLNCMDSVFCVRSDACSDYQKRFPAISERFRFMPTWMNTDLFFRRDATGRSAARAGLRSEFAVCDDAKMLMAVGRLDHQKNPLLLVDAFAQVAAKRDDVFLVIVGEGVLRGAVQSRIASLGMEKRIFLAGQRRPEVIAAMLSGADLYVMSSAYEGMPISVLEALACGLPVVSTDVGEVARVLRSGYNGVLVTEHTQAALASAIQSVLDESWEPMAEAASASVESYVPDRVLLPVYEAYRRAAASVLQQHVPA